MSKKNPQVRNPPTPPRPETPQLVVIWKDPIDTTPQASGSYSKLTDFGWQLRDNPGTWALWRDDFPTNRSARQWASGARRGMYPTLGVGFETVAEDRSVFVRWPPDDEQDTTVE